MQAGTAPTIPAAGAIPQTPDAFPDTIEYDETRQRLRVGTGFVEHRCNGVDPRVGGMELVDALSLLRVQAAS